MIRILLQESHRMENNWMRQLGKWTKDEVAVLIFGEKHLGGLNKNHRLGRLHCSTSWSAEKLVTLDPSWLHSWSSRQNRSWCYFRLLHRSWTITGMDRTLLQSKWKQTFVLCYKTSHSEGGMRKIDLVLLYTWKVLLWAHRCPSYNEFV